MRFILALITGMLALGGVGCAGEDATDPTDSDEPGISTSDRLALWLAGDFDSSDQAAADADYFAIRMQICKVDLPELGDQVLYVEQAQVTDQANPYRQRLYLIEPGATEDQGVSRIYTLANTAAIKGLCEGNGTLPSASTATEKVGCAVTMTWDGTSFSGGTTGEDCATTLGGDYAASEITITRDQLTSWDRGFFNDGTQAWGATGGGYVFVRRSEAPSE
ncbi:MAG: chromophore lyase CpcT/CpeT [Myxococcota bacterium]